MKIKVWFFALAIALTSCNKDDYEEVRSNGNLVTTEISIPNFTGVFANSGCEVVLKNGPVQKVTTTISENILQHINTVVSSSGIWEIDFKDGDNIATINDHTWQMTIESPNINYVENDGSGGLTCQDTLTASSLTVKHLSSSSTSILCNTQSLTTIHDAGGNLQISGNANAHNFTKMGGGIFKGFELNTNTMDMNKDGGGNCEIKVASNLSGTIDGGGNVYYKGMPTINVQNLGGSGQLIDAN